jgi:hypothetical protein
MIKQEDVKKSDGSVMDEVKSPPLKMISLFAGLTVLALGYVYMCSFLLS